MVVRVGAGCVGRSVCVTDDRYKGQADDWMLIVRPQNLDPSFLAFYLNSSIGKAFVQKEAQGTGTVSISKGKLQKILVPMIADSEQSEFASEVRKMYEAQRLGRIDKARTIFASLERKLQELVLKQ